MALFKFVKNFIKKFPVFQQGSKFSLLVFRTLTRNLFTQFTHLDIFTKSLLNRDRRSKMLRTEYKTVN